ncbi:response regulator [Bacteriovorax sp. Seq25_V]|uniref:response regulator n=1 Tax=Bacteriovorax sp. Seq25_V TaxID=1201288 RepID=UPI00038A3600|nr:response regulator [Bacteriovorax sp. Seq25_V]EQC44376.1 response regulator receiver domain protein [Bacteriovorax sp. Seq25_V]
MKFLVVDDEALIRQFITLVLENNFESPSIFEATNSKDAIDLCMQHRDFDGVITDFEMPGGNGDLLLNHLYDSMFKGKVVLHTSRDLNELGEATKNYSGSNRLHYIQKPTLFKEFTKLLCDLFTSVNDEEYRRVKIAYFYRYNKALCDVYLKINDEKYLKIIHASDHYTKADISKYIDRNLDYLYVKDQDLEAFANQVGSTPFLKFIATNEGLEDKEESFVRIHTILKELISSVGVDKTVIETAEVYVKTVDEVMADNKNLTNLLFKLRHRRDYLYDHSFLTACLASFLVKKMSWYNPKMLEKLCFSALFHDITLVDPEIALVHDIRSSEIRKFSIEEITAFKNHPLQVAKLLENLPIFDQDVENIISAHHELEDGQGFPKKLQGRSLRPLTCIFILAHEFVRLMYIQNFDERSHKDILTYLFNTYNSGNFRDVLDALYQTLQLNPLTED